jgi:hypothetical protein
MSPFDIVEVSQEERFQHALDVNDCTALFVAERLDAG